MEPEIVSQIVIGTATVLAALGGFAVAGITDSFRDKRAAKRELENHQTRRQEERRDRSEKSSSRTYLRCKTHFRLSQD